MRMLPTGTITLFFADIERSTALLRELGPERFGAALVEYRQLIRDAVTSHDGVEVDAEGDAFFAVFRSAREAVAAAGEAQSALNERRLHVRMGLHTGEPLVVNGHYSGIDVHQAARIAAAGHGGQILISRSTRELLEPATSISDLGLHRLRDLGEPVDLYQVGSGEFPPVRSLNFTNLPIQPTALIGRDRELKEAGELVRRQRLVTLTGPGGSGKTRLALQVAADAVEEFPEGVVWVPLQGLRDPELVLPTISRALAESESLGDRVVDRRVLLVLDNFEQLLDSVSRVGDLLAQLPQLTLLVTSREPLHLAAEHEYPVAPLREREALSLFIARATAAKPDFDDEGPVLEICRRLDCLPLALELAAARVKALSADELLERLDRRLPILTGGPRDAPERQRTLRATIAWSYELLTAEEKRVFARLAVFTGSSSLEAAEQVCQADLDTIAALIDKSLLGREGDRYFMLETIGEYALECLEKSGELEELQQRHAEYFLEQTRSIERLIRSPQAARVVDRLEQDYGNLRAVLRLFSDATPDQSLQLAMWGLAARLHGFGDEALDRRDVNEAARLYRESLEIGLQLKDDTQMAYCVAGLAAVCAERGRRNEATRLWASVIDFERTLGSPLHEPARRRYERVLAGLEPGSEASTEAADGGAMRLEDAVDYALATLE
jgi:predicted ATPase/class 3 adenylate cyclase